MRGIRFLLLLVPILAGCKEEPTAIDEGDIQTYVLVSINGAGLPQQFEDSQGAFDIVGGRILMHENGSFSDEIDFEFELDGETVEHTQVAAGIYAVAGTNILLNYSAFEISDVEGTLEGGTLTLTTDDVSFVYELE